MMQLHKTTLIKIFTFSLILFGFLLNCSSAHAVDSKCNKLSTDGKKYITKITNIKVKSGSNDKFDLSISWGSLCANSTCKRSNTPVCSHPSASDGSDQAFSAVGTRSITVHKNATKACTKFSSSRKCEFYTARYIPSDCSNTKNSYGYIGHQSIDFKFERVLPTYTITVKVLDFYTHSEISEYSNSVTVNSGDSKTVSGLFTIPNYFFRGWETCPSASDTDCTVSNVTSNQTFYINYQQKSTLTMQPVSTTGESLIGITGFNSASTTVWQGDSASLSNNSTNTEYTFKGWKTDTTGDIVSTDSTYTIASLTADTTIYAVYEKEDSFPPETYTSTLDVKVKNNDVSNYGSYSQNNIYARPGNTLSFQVTYDPGAQASYSSKPQRIRIGDSATSLPSENNTDLTLAQLFNNNRNTSVYGPWTNTIIFDNTYTYDVGDTSIKTETVEYKVEAKDVGKNIQKTASTQSNINGTTPKEVTLKSIGGNITGIISSGLNGSAQAFIPYNYLNTTTVSTPDNNAIYAGEVTNFDFSITVNKKPNNLLGGDEYATIVEDAYWKTGISYNGNPYEWSEPAKGTLNKDHNLNGSTEEKKGNAIVIPDVSAGSRVCIRSAVYPKDSKDGLTKQPYDINSDDSWSYSEEKCFQVAKRPSIQILGGNVYSNGSINTDPSIKVHLQGTNEYSTNMPNDPYIFGSWGELGVISNGPVSGFASGATLGYGPNHGQVGGYHGKYEFCKLSPLSFANSNCSSGTVGNIGTSSALNGINADRTTLQNFVSKFSGNDTKAEYNNGDLVAISDEATTYYHSNGDLSISSSNIPAAAVKVVHAKGNISINGNITYHNDGYTKLDQTPKLVIYSEKNITINCEVYRIDAVLLANTVKTCNSDDINSGANSHQLVVNGAILANKLIANRTYGAASGTNSIVPAEVIDFDPTLYIWNSLINTSTEEGSHSEGSQQYQSNGELDEVYVHELAPLF